MMSPFERINSHGYCLFPGLLNPADIDKLRQGVHHFFQQSGVYYDFGKTQPDAFSNVDSIRWLLKDPRILDAVASCMGGDDFVYTMHSDIHMNMLSGWHTDTGAYFDRADVLDPSFRVLKVGIYLQDHSVDARGLTVSKGSHLAAETKPALKNVEALKTSVGDVVVFDTRIWHVGDQKTKFERIFGKLLNSERLKYRSGGLLRALTGRKDKSSVFFTFGLPNELTVLFSERNALRQEKQISTRRDAVSGAQAQALSEFLRKERLKTYLDLPQRN